MTDAGSWTYHTAILARSIRVPAVAGLRNASATVAPGALVAVDGTEGEVLVDPDPDLLAQVQARRKKLLALEQSLDEYRELPAVTESTSPAPVSNFHSPSAARKSVAEPPDAGTIPESADVNSGSRFA